MPKTGHKRKPSISWKIGVNNKYDEKHVKVVLAGPMVVFFFIFLCFLLLLLVCIYLFFSYPLIATVRSELTTIKLDYQNNI